MRVRAWVLALISVAIIFGGIALASTLGYWNTTNDKIPALISVGEYAGQANPMDIRGSYSFVDIGKNFGIPLDSLREAFGVENVEDFKCKDLETLYGNFEGIEIGTESVRYFVSLYVGIPVDDADAADLPSSAADVLIGLGTLTNSQLEQLSTHTFDLQ